MSWTPTNEQVEKATEVVIHEMGLLPEEAESMHEDVARAVLVAVGPDIAAGALRDAAVALRATGPTAPALLRARADQIEKEAGR
jgi:hypothetical protein